MSPTTNILDIFSFIRDTDLTDFPWFQNITKLTLEFFPFTLKIYSSTKHRKFWWNVEEWVSARMAEPLWRTGRRCPRIELPDNLTIPLWLHAQRSKFWKRHHPSLYTKSITVQSASGLMFGLIARRPGHRVDPRMGSRKERNITRQCRRQWYRDSSCSLMILSISPDRHLCTGTLTPS